MRKQRRRSVTAKLISAFVFATSIVQSLFFLNPKFQASSHLLWLYSPVCIGPGRKPRRPVFSQRASNNWQFGYPSRRNNQESARKCNTSIFPNQLHYYSHSAKIFRNGHRPKFGLKLHSGPHQKQFGGTYCHRENLRRATEKVIEGPEVCSRTKVSNMEP